MKFLIIGLGNFGQTLATTLTDNGHDVIGVDNSEEMLSIAMNKKYENGNNILTMTKKI